MTILWDGLSGWRILPRYWDIAEKGCHGQEGPWFSLTDDLWKSS